MLAEALKMQGSGEVISTHGPGEKIKGLFRLLMFLQHGRPKKKAILL